MVAGFVAIVLVNSEIRYRILYRFFVSDRIEAHLIFLAQRVLVFQRELIVAMFKDGGSFHRSRGEAGATCVWRTFPTAKRAGGLRRKIRRRGHDNKPIPES